LERSCSHFFYTDAGCALSVEIYFKKFFIIKKELYSFQRSIQLDF